MSPAFPGGMEAAPHRLRLAVLLGVLLGALVPAAGGEDPVPTVDPGLRPLEAWLGAGDPVLRGMAAFELRRHDTPGAVLLARRVLEGEQDFVVLGCALSSLTVRPRVELVAEGGTILPGLLLRLTEHAHPVVRERSWALLRTLAKQDHGKESDAWRAWWLAARRSLTEEQRRVLRSRGARPAGESVPAQPGESETTTAEPPPDLYDYVANLRRDGLEVCIVMDHTGSMAPVIGRATARAASLVNRLAWLVPGFRAGLVTYDDQARLRIALTGDGEALAKAFRKVTASGGGDWEEGVDKGIALAFRQEEVAWSQRAHRVLVVIGDAPPHLGDVAGLVRRIRKARDDVIYAHPIVLNTVSTRPGGVDHFGAIATAGGGVHVTLENASRLEEELVALTFGAAFRDQVRPWLREVEELRRAAPR